MNTKLHKRKRIPDEFFSLMGKHEVEIHGVKVIAHTADCPDVVTKHIYDLPRHVQSSKTKVVGVDLKKSTDQYPRQHMLALCASSLCLIIRLESMGLQLPDLLLKFLQDTNICFVGLEKLPDSDLYDREFRGLEIGVELGELVARVLNKPGLITSGLADIAQEVGVSYEAPTTLTTGERKPFVLSDDEVKVVINEAFAYYLIGHKLLSSLKTNHCSIKLENIH